MRPLSAALIEDLAPEDRVNFCCSHCRQVVWLTREMLLNRGFTPNVKVLDLERRLPCIDCGAQGRALVWVQWAKRFE